MEALFAPDDIDLLHTFLEEARARRFLGATALRHGEGLFTRWSGRCYPIGQLVLSRQYERREYEQLLKRGEIFDAMSVALCGDARLRAADAQTAQSRVAKASWNSPLTFGTLPSGASCTPATYDWFTVEWGTNSGEVDYEWRYKPLARVLAENIDMADRLAKPSR